MLFSQYSPCVKRGPNRISTASQYKVATDRLIQFVSPAAEPTCMRRLVPDYSTTRTIKWMGGGGGTTSIKLKAGKKKNKNYPE
jgi:hypothetical protein